MSTLTADTITVTRHHNGLRNVADRLQIGNHEDGSASIREYRIPTGYRYDRVENRLIDPSGALCEVVLDGHDRTVCMSLVGACPDRLMVEVE